MPDLVYIYIIFNFVWVTFPVVCHTSIQAQLECYRQSDYFICVYLPYFDSSFLLFIR